MLFTKRWYALTISVLLIGCSASPPPLEAFDSNRWKADTEACLGQRAKLVTSLLSQKEKLLAISEREMVARLGKPDKNELYEHNQKFYYYYLTAGPACVKSDSTARLLEIRFNATGVSSEILEVVESFERSGD